MSKPMEPQAAEPPHDGADSALSPSDAQLVAQVLGGARPAFDELIKRHQKQAVAVSYRLLGNTNDALEVTQDAFLKAYTSLATLQKPEAFGGWLMRIVSNLSLNYRRGRKLRAQLPLENMLGTGTGGQEESGGSEWMSRSGDPLHNLEGRELGQKLQEALLKLPERQRQAILMFTVEQKSQKDVAVALDCSVEAVKWYVFQGRKRLKELLKELL